VGTQRDEEGDYEGAFEYYTKAVELGDAHAHFQLSCLYRKGQGVEKDEKKELHHLEEAAIAGHPDARYNLACYEGGNGRIERAVKHLIIAANLGCDDSLKGLKECYADGRCSKEDFAAALRAHQAAVDATKSPQREEAEAARERNKG
jgi:TPR repeat protein